MLLVLSLLLVPVLAQRPSNASLCDYYAIQLFGANTTSSQFSLVQNIVALAFAGGSGVANASSALTGNFNPGSFLNPVTSQDINVDLRPWFNGSIDSTNVNGDPSTVNWLDGGGQAPLTAYLSGKTSSIVLGNTTNEYQLFNHWLSAFSHIFGCTIPPPLPPSTGPILNLAYVHKFMDLNQTDIGYFIDQLALSAAHFGFSQQDSSSLSTQLNAKYNVRCSPPVGTQLYSLCQDETCPLDPSPDCAAYVDLGPSGVVSSGPAPSSTSAQFTPSTVATPSATHSPTTTATSSPTSTQTSAPPSSSTLTSGAIAGIAIGGGALIFAFILALVYLLKKKNKVEASVYEPSPSNPSYITPARTDPHSSYHSNQIVQGWNGPPIPEMESPGSPDPYQHFSP
ncbi:uncharacterized protein LY89DRAFT_581946 [Mollisia scopiformis]|uniref:Uncharacterized protein n=1 Tax=Mollisia scopiformis TaxID=149040 RepID=A0A194XFL2_MOLSC|nr:uncharacterized protein LY89DRAFT_581946 [Mollisia scopiformis]KUJ18985.1 hypothetical protein LY89DRAFT_581946 [Mollisia scopiformis]